MCNAAIRRESRRRHSPAPRAALSRSRSPPTSHSNDPTMIVPTALTLRSPKRQHDDGQEPIARQRASQSPGSTDRQNIPRQRPTVDRQEFDRINSCQPTEIDRGPTEIDRVLTGTMLVLCQAVNRQTDRGRQRPTEADRIPTEARQIDRDQQSSRVSTSLHPFISWLNARSWAQAHC